MALVSNQLYNRENSLIFIKNESIFIQLKNLSIFKVNQSLVSVLTTESFYKPHYYTGFPKMNLVLYNFMTWNYFYFLKLHEFYPRHFVHVPNLFCLVLILLAYISRTFPFVPNLSNKLIFIRKLFKVSLLALFCFQKMSISVF